MKTKQMLKRWNGDVNIYISSNGMTYINLKDKKISTAFHLDEFDDNCKKIKEVINKYV